MGHTRDVLTFPLKISEQEINAVVSDWNYNHMDWKEAGYPHRENYSVKTIYERNRIFDSFDDAVEYVKYKADWGGYAVKYREYPEFKPTKAMQDLQKRIFEYRKRIDALNKPHYKGVKQATIKCKRCGASLPTSYCGKTWFNDCPICRAELRPQSVLDKQKNYRNTLKDLEKRYNTEVKKINEKNEAKAEIKWCVGVDAHS